MELTKTEFKQTEIGLIPESWIQNTIPDIALLNEKGIKIGPFGSALKKELLVKKGYKVYGQENIFDKDVEIGDRYITKEHFYKLKSCELVEGDFVISMMGTIGQCMIMPNNIQKGIMDSHLLRIKLNREVVHPLFFEHIFKSTLTFQQINKLSVGGIMDGLSSTIIKKIQIAIPPLPEQKAIAQVLSDTDNLIQTIEQKLTKKRAIKQGAMQRLLTPKADWVVKQLGSIAHFYNGKAHEQFIDSNGGFAVINSKFVSTSGKVYKNATVNLCPLKKGDITMVMSDIPNGKALAKCFLVPTDNKYALNQRICAIRTEEVDTEFLYFILNRNKYYLAFDSGTGQTNLKKNDVLECPIPLPKTKQEQAEIATILLDMNKEIEQLEQKLSKYKMVKQGLMQNLLTGKIRLV